MILSRTGPAITERDLERFEKEISGRLPLDYKRFLMEPNGGIPVDEIWFDVENERYEICGFNGLKENHGLRAHYENLRKFRSGFLPIASDFGGSDVCIEFLPPSGKIFLAHYETNDSGVDIDANLVFLAESFRDFLNLLEIRPKQFDAVVELAEHGSILDLEEFLRHNSIDSRSNSNLTLLSECIRQKNAQLFGECLNRGALLDGALEIAVQAKSLDMVKKLVDNGAEVNKANDNGNTPLFFAVGPSRREIRKFLKERE